MSIILVGVNHKTAPVEIRERLALSDEACAEGLRRLVDGEVAVPEDDDRLIVDLRLEVEAAVLASHRANDRHPVAAGLLGGQPGVPQLDPAQCVRVVDICYQGDDRAVALVRAHSSPPSRRALKVVM